MLRKLTWEELDLDVEFDAIDKDNKGKIFFEDMVNWVLDKTMKIELFKQDEREKAVAEETAQENEQ